MTWEFFTADPGHVQILLGMPLIFLTVSYLLAMRRAIYAKRRIAVLEEELEEEKQENNSMVGYLYHRLPYDEFRSLCIEVLDHEDADWPERGDNKAPADS